jgi:thiol-disulfide isomerase/thioredoxin
MKYAMKKIITLLVAVLFVSNLFGQHVDENIYLKKLHEDLLSIRKMDSLDRKVVNQKLNERIEQAKKFIDFKKFTIDEIKLFAKEDILFNSDNFRKVVYPALSKMAKNKNLEGAVAAGYKVLYFPGAIDESSYKNSLKWSEDYKSLLKHPAIQSLLISEESVGREVFLRLRSMDIKAIAQSGLIKSYLPILDYKMNDRIASNAYLLFDQSANPESKTDPITNELIRKKLVIITNDVLTRKKDKYLEGIKKYLEGNFARGELIGKPAPSVDFMWHNKNPNIKSLTDLKGKVVILDFWATWCTPCVESFPNLVKLQERYKDYPVEIVGLTSIQGSHNDRVNKKRIKLQGKPEEEMALMHQFMKDLAMTWNVVFSTENVFNKDFGVRSIPHVAIIDPAGVVRYNMLDTYDAPYHEAEKVDAILKEFKMDFPKIAMDKMNYVKN